MSLIDKLRQLVGPSTPVGKPAEEAQPSHEHADTPYGVQRLLDSVRDVMADHAALAAEDTEIETNLRFWSERLKQAERLVEREEVGTPGALRASELAGTATTRLAELAQRRKAIEEAVEASCPLYDEVNIILGEVRAAQNRDGDASPGLGLEDAAAEAAYECLQLPGPRGLTRLERLRDLDRQLRTILARAQASQRQHVA